MMNDESSEHLFIDNNTIIEKLKSKKETGDNSQKFIETVKYVIFEIDKQLFALPGDIVKEILIDYEIYYLPFMPPYIRGLINRHGEPYTVLDLKILFKKEKLEGRKFIIIRDSFDKLSLLITDISKIINIEKKNINKITSKNENNDYFLTAIYFDNAEIPVLNIDMIVKKIENDIQ